MKKYEEDEYYKLYQELTDVVKECGILQYYDYDKIKSYAVYIWTKATDPSDMDTWGRNLFDIQAEEVVFYGERHEVIKEAWPAIKEIQAQLLKMEKLAEK